MIPLINMDHELYCLKGSFSLLIADFKKSHVYEMKLL